MPRPRRPRRRRRRPRTRSPRSSRRPSRPTPRPRWLRRPPPARRRRRRSTFRRCPKRLFNLRPPGVVSALPTLRESDVPHSAALMSTEELARRLGAPGLRIFDCTTYLRPRPEGGYNAESGRANYDKGHIPGAAFLDLGGELSDPLSKLRLTLPPLGDLTKAFAAKGIGHGTFVVLYSHASPVWATRIWWMLRAVGFD